MVRDGLILAITIEGRVSTTRVIKRVPIFKIIRWVRLKLTGTYSRK
jgi:hypothetical protein